MLAKTFSKSDTLGIIFPNTFDDLIPELVGERSVASIPFASRYRLIDFTLSSMVHSGIEDIVVACTKNYNSLSNHIGSGKEWDLGRKNGGLLLFPPLAENQYTSWEGRIAILKGLLRMLKDDKHEFVVMTDNNFAANMDFQEMLRTHVSTGADITCVYTKNEIPEEFKLHMDKGIYYYTYDVCEENRINNIVINDTTDGVKNFALNVYILRRELLVKLVDDAIFNGGKYFVRDVLSKNLDSLKINALEYTGYIARIFNIPSYFAENMKLLEEENLDALFGKNTIYTKIRDDNPTRYIGDAVVENVLAADGCVIEGEVRNSILFKGVKIGKGAKVENCILMQDTVVGEGCNISRVIADKNVVIEDTTPISGPASFPIVYKKGLHI